MTEYDEWGRPIRDDEDYIPQDPSGRYLICKSTDKKERFLKQSGSGWTDYHNAGLFKIY